MRDRRKERRWRRRRRKKIRFSLTKPVPKHDDLRSSCISGRAGPTT